MRNVNRWLGLVLAGALLLCATGASAADWPQWRGANRDGKATDFKAPATWPQALKQAWKVDVGAGDASPVLVGDKIFVFARQGDNEVIQCLNAADGAKAWEDKYPSAAFSGPDARAHMGPRSTPAVADGKIVTLGVAGTVTCWDVATHKQLWQKSEVKGTPRFHLAPSPLIAEGLAIVQLGGGQDGGVFAYDLASGAEKWKWAGEGPGYSSPVLMAADGAKQIVAMTEKSVVGLDLADGKLAWQIPFPVQGMMAYNAATPIVDGQTVIITGSGRGTKAFKIEKVGEKYNPTKLWENPTGTQFCTPVLKDGFLYGLSDKKSFFCINAKDGKEAWTDAGRVDNYGAMVDAGTAVLALPSNSTMVALKPDGVKFTELAKIKVSETPTFACPIVTGNKIYIKDKDALLALTVE